MTEPQWTEDLTPEQQAELGNFSRQVGPYLDQYETPEVDTPALMTALRAHLPAVDTASNVPLVADSPFVGVRGWLKLARMQLGLVSSSTWGASLLLIALGLLILFAGRDMAAVLFVLVSPLLAVVGVAYIFRPAARSLREMELLSPINPLELLYARLILLLALNAIPTVILLLLVWQQDSQIVLWRLLLVWFGPMMGMAGLALYATIRWNMLAGAVAPLALWVAFVAIGWREWVTAPAPIWSGVMQTILLSDAVLLGAIFALLLGLIFIWGSSHLVREQSRFVTR